MYKSSTSRISSKKRAVITACVVLVILSVGSVLLYKSKHTTTPQDRAVTASSSINLDKPTPEEAKAGDTQKDVNVERGKIDTTPTAAPTSADVRITDATQYDSSIEVRAYVTNIYEDGICTATFTKTGQPSVITKSTAFKDVSTTQCGGNDTSRSKFTSTGQWQLTLTFQSTTGKTGTATKIVEIK